MLAKDTQPIVDLGVGRWYSWCMHKRPPDSSSIFLSSVPLQSPDVAGKLPPYSSICCFSPWPPWQASGPPSFFATGTEMVKDLSLLFLAVTVALHRVLSQISRRLASVRAPDTNMGPILPCRSIAARQAFVAGPSQASLGRAALLQANAAMIECDGLG